MSMFDIIQIDDWQAYADEQMGTKRKMWFLSPSGDKYLFKYPRPGSGEAWAEKAAAEIASLMQITHAQVELAVFNGEKGTISKSFIADPQSYLYHGNQLLHIAMPTYDMSKKIGQREHTYTRIMEIILGFDTKPPSNLFDNSLASDSATCIAGYLTLDALISNSDRHHENWAVIFGFTRKADGSIAINNVELAPTFDHASSFGRELSDEQRRELLSDRTKLDRYTSKCPSRIYLNEEDNKPMHPVELVRRGALLSPESYKPWVCKAVALDRDGIGSILNSFPLEWMSLDSKAFAAELIRSNQAALNQVREEVFG